MAKGAIGQFATRWVTKDGKRRNHICLTCKHEWPAEDRWFRWPIRPCLVNPWRHRWRHDGPGGGLPGCLRYGLHDLRFSCYWKPCRWGWEWGSDREWRRWFVRVYGWGLLRVACGPRDPQQRPDEVVCPNCGVAYWRKPDGKAAVRMLRRERDYFMRLEAHWCGQYGRLREHLMAIEARYVPESLWLALDTPEAIEGGRELDPVETRERARPTAAPERDPLPAEVAAD